MERFIIIIIVSILNLIPSLIVHFLICGLQSEPFSDSLFKMKTINMDDLKKRATKYITIKENMFKKLHSPTLGKVNKWNSIERVATQYSHHTSLNVSRDVIHQDMCNLELIRLPKPWPPHPFANLLKCCFYHQSINHNTKEY